MKIISNIENFNNEGLILTIGFFDGVHIGHRFLINQMYELAKRKKLKTAILTFWPHPRIVLDEEYKPSLLNDLEEKQEKLKNLPLDYCINIPFTTKLSNLYAFDFMKSVLKEKLNVKHLVVGYDHRFGKNREEGFDDYCKYGKELGIDVTQAIPYVDDGFTISSSFIRSLIKSGEVKLASKYLGYTYHIKGVVIEGHKVGRSIGFPTANLKLNIPNKCIPKVGVYAIKAKTKKGIYEGMLYIGNRPTIGSDDENSIEANLFDFNQDIYGEEIELALIDFVRSQEKFDNIETLKTHIASDKEKTINILKSFGL